MLILWFLHVDFCSPLQSGYNPATFRPYLLKREHAWRDTPAIFYLLD